MKGRKALEKMAFCDILGHQKQLEILQSGLANHRLHHAYLFLGPEGVGKKTIAYALAMAIHCRSAAQDFCKECDDCLKIQDGNHPDVRFIGPLAGKKDISIQQVRELEKGLSFRSFSGKKKIAILDPATLMNLAAQNALLKTLEEPPGDSLLILIAASAGGLLPTLLSRCLRVSFGPLPLDLVAGYLRSEKGLSAEEAGLLAALAMGSLGKALGEEIKEFVERRSSWVEGLSSLSDGDFRAGAALAEKLAGDRDEALRFLEWAEGWYRDVLLHAVAGRPHGICNADRVPDLERHASRYRHETLLSLFFQAGKTIGLIRRNVNRRMALEQFFFQVARAQ